MASNSLRVSAELFEQARSEGELLSRSTAQQLEHWARLGRQLEALGLTVADVKSLLDERRGDEELWAYKRARQAQDMANMASGAVKQESLMWFSGGKARRMRIPNSPL